MLSSKLRNQILHCYEDNPRIALPDLPIWDIDGGCCLKKRITIEKAKLIKLKYKVWNYITSTYMFWNIFSIPNFSCNSDSALNYYIKRIILGCKHFVHTNRRDGININLRTSLSPKAFGDKRTSTLRVQTGVKDWDNGLCATST